MAEKWQTWQKIILVLAIIIVLIVAYLILNSLGYLVFFSPLSIIIQDIPPANINEQWGDIPINIKAPYIGSITSESGRAFCGNNDGDVTITNNYEISETLFLESSIGSSTDYGIACGGNYIYLEMQLPKGNLTVDYDLAASASKHFCGSTSIINIVGYSEFRVVGCDPNWGTDPPLSGTYSILLEEPKTITVKLETSKTNRGSATASAELSFTPESAELECEVDEDCETGETCESNFCVPIETECSLDSDCPEGYECNTAGECVLTDIPSQTNWKLIAGIVAAVLVVVAGIVFALSSRKGKKR